MSDEFVFGLRTDDPPGPPPPRSPRSREHARAIKRRRLTVIGVLTLLVVGLIVGGVYAVNSVVAVFSSAPSDYTGDGTGTVRVTIDSGDSLSQMGQRLVSAGVVKSVGAFDAAAAVNPASIGIQPGVYELKQHMSASAAIALLLSPGARLTTTVVIPEGTRTADVIAILSHKLSIPLADFASVVAHPTMTLPPACGGQLEGCLFPATYQFQPGLSATQVLQVMLNRFIVEERLSNLTAGAAALHLTPQQVLTIASIEEMEAGLVKDYPKVARTILNRLAAGMHLQLDSTVQYGLHIHTTKVSIADTQVPTPYNTYLNAGLPPTPIDNPGHAAIIAALHPATGDWLYFITMDKKGDSAFTNSYSEFLTLKAQSEANLGNG